MAASVQLFTIPIGEGVLVYRPLAGLAFVGNQAMARLALRLAAGEEPEGQAEARAFLAGTGFLQPDPAPPPARDRAFRPAHAVLLLTSRCSLRCVYCYAGAGEGRAQTMPAALARVAIDQVCGQARDQGLASFELTFHGGGEPVQAWPTLEAAVVHARARDLPAHITLVSNGVWTKRQRDWLLGSLDRVTISCDGAPETQDRQRPLASGRGSSRAVMATIRELDRLGFDYGVRMTALAPWHERLATDVRFLLEETGCRSIQVEPAFNTRRGAYQAPSPAACDEFVAAFLEAHDLARRAGRRLSYSGARPGLLTASFCSAPYSSLVVTPAGRLVSCYEVTGDGHPLAATCTVGRLDVDRGTQIDEERRAALLARMEARRQACSDCFCAWHCAGDCHVKAFYPSVEADGGRCRINRAITLELLLREVAAAPDGVWHSSRRPQVPEGDV